MTEPQLAAAANYLRTALGQNSLAVIVGAGVSIGATEPRTQTVSWEGLLRDGMEWAATHIPEAERDSFKNTIDNLLATNNHLMAAELVAKKLREKNLYSPWLDAAFSDIKIRDGSALDALASLHQRGALICTTNYDNILEDRLGVDPIHRSIANDVQGFVNGAKKGVLHIHGHYSRPNDVVLDYRSYEDVVRDDKYLQGQLRGLFIGKTVLFVGCGGGVRDRNFTALLEWLGDTLVGTGISRHRMLVSPSQIPDVGTVPGVAMVPCEHPQIPDFLRRVAGEATAFLDLTTFDGNTLIAIEGEVKSQTGVVRFDDTFQLGADLVGYDHYAEHKWTEWSDKIEKKRQKVLHLTDEGAHPLHLVLGGRAPLSLFVRAGTEFPRGGSIRYTFVNRRDRETPIAWDILPLGIAPPQVQDASPLLSREDVFRSGSKGVLVFALTVQHRLNPTNIDNLKRRLGSVCAVAEMHPASDCALTVDKSNINQLEDEIQKHMEEVVRDYRENMEQHGLAVVVAGPTSLAFVIGQSVRMNIVGGVRYMKYRAGDYEEVFVDHASVTETDQSKPLQDGMPPSTATASDDVSVQGRLTGSMADTPLTADIGEGSTRTTVQSPVWTWKVLFFKIHIEYDKFEMDQFINSLLAALGGTRSQIRNGRVIRACVHVHIEMESTLVDILTVNVESLSTRMGYSFRFTVDNGREFIAEDHGPKNTAKGYERSTGPRTQRANVGESSTSTSVPVTPAVVSHSDPVSLPVHRHILGYLHISDFHCYYEPKHRQFMGHLTNSIKQHKKFFKNHIIDVVFVTGDLVKAPEMGFDGFAKFFKEKVLDVLGISAEKVLVVPGNHDVQRVGQFRNDMEGRVVDRVSIAPIEEARKDVDWFHRKCDNGKSNWDEESDSLVDRVRFRSYSEFVKSQGFNQNTATLAGPDWYKSFDSAGVECHILGLNTALVANGDDDKGKLCISPPAVDKLVELGAYPISPEDRARRLVIVLGHHSLDWLNVPGQRSQSVLVRRTISENADIYLFGHEHTSTLEPNPKTNDRRFVEAGAVYDKEHEYGDQIEHAQFCYGEVVVKSGEKKLEVTPFVCTYEHPTEFIQDSMQEVSLHPAQDIILPHTVQLYSSATGNISAGSGSHVGGLVGHNVGSSITGSHATGNVSVGSGSHGSDVRLAESQCDELKKMEKILVLYHKDEEELKEHVCQTVEAATEDMKEHVSQEMGVATATIVEELEKLDIKAPSTSKMPLPLQNCFDSNNDVVESHELYPGTREKLLSEIQDWLRKDTTHPPVFWIYGPHGVGKTALLSHVWKSSTFSGAKVLHCFKYGDIGRMKTGFAVKSLACQMWRHIPEYQAAFSADDNLASISPEEFGKLFWYLVVSPLKTMDRKGYSQELLLILDALDESEDIDALIDFLLHHDSVKDALPSWAKILVSSVPPPAEEPSHIVCKSVPYGTEDGDVKSYIHSFVHDKLKDADEESIMSVERQILDESEGIFLLARLFRDNPGLLEETTHPKSGMAYVFKEYLSRVFEEPFKEQDETSTAEEICSAIEKILSVIIALGPTVGLSTLNGVLERSDGIKDGIRDSAYSYLKSFAEHMNSDGISILLCIWKWLRDSSIRTSATRKVKRWDPFVRRVTNSPDNIQSGHDRIVRAIQNPQFEAESLKKIVQLYCATSQLERAEEAYSFLKKRSDVSFIKEAVDVFLTKVGVNAMDEAKKFILNELKDNRDSNEPALYAITRVIEVFFRKDELGAAEQAFSIIKEYADPFIYGRFISQYGIVERRYEKADELFSELHDSGRVTSMVLSMMMKVCAERKKFYRIRELLESFPDFRNDPFIHVYVAKSLGQSKQPVDKDESSKLLDELLKKDIAGLGLTPSGYYVLMDACAEIGRVAELERIASSLSSLSFKLDDTYLSLKVKGYIRADKLDEARNVLDEVDPSEISASRCYDQLIREYSKRNQTDVVDELVKEMEGKKIKLDVFNKNTILESYVYNNRCFEAAAYYEQFKDSANKRTKELMDELPEREAINLSMKVKEHIRADKLDEARKLLDEANPMVDTAVHSYDQLIREYSKRNQTDVVDELVKEMEGKKIKLDVLNKNTILESYVYNNRFSEAEAYYEQFKDSANKRTEELMRSLRSKRRKRT